MKIKAQKEKAVKMYSGGDGGALLRAPSALLPVYLNSPFLHGKLPRCRPEAANGSLDGTQSLFFFFYLFFPWHGRP